MKKLLIFLFVIAALVRCKEDEWPPAHKDTDIGCQFSDKIGSPDRVFIRCATWKEFQAKSDTLNGGTSQYTPDNTWVQAASCSECK